MKCKFLLLVLVLFYLTGCQTPEEKALEMTFFKEPKSGLCFAQRGWGYDFGIVTHVPCTPEVEALIKSKS